MTGQIQPYVARGGMEIIPNPNIFGMADIEKMAIVMAKSGLFGVKTPEHAMALMLIAQAEGKHPATIADSFDIIQGRAAKKPTAMMADFLLANGKVEWHTVSDELVEATFSHPSGGSARIKWDMDDARRAGLAGKDNWKKYPRQMLRARVTGEGIRTVCPGATSGTYTPEEIEELGPNHDGPIKSRTEQARAMIPKKETKPKAAEEDPPPPASDDVPEVQVEGSEDIADAEVIEEPAPEPEQPADPQRERLTEMRVHLETAFKFTPEQAKDGLLAFFAAYEKKPGAVKDEAVFKSLLANLKKKNQQQIEALMKSYAKSKAAETAE